MSLRRIRLPNKPLVISSLGDSVYIGDAHGFAYEMKPPYISRTVILQSSGPISALAVGKDVYYGNWDGDVGVVGGKKINLGGEIVKCMLIHGDRIYVSVGLMVYGLSLGLDIECSYEVKHKVLCMSAFQGSVYCGMGVSFLSRIHDEFEIIGRSLHDTSIFCICGEYTGSADGRVLRQDYCDLDNAEEIYKGNNWIRSIYNQYLFSDGRNVMADVDGLKGNGSCGVKPIYSHEEDVLGVIKVGGTVISIGLDYCYCVFEIAPGLSPEEEMEIAELMNE
ncbi:hypothetical protein EHEL_031020 [Encephalitozoon hellem ATCC 50504]|uniref:WD40 domain-containing protein n=1 Tax=Encephalitozoon hellem TaxID=27973 RepID=A0A9Q9F970_ENCHE|nr:uncharacterized protein EHEL_031020 [Encephalitozoon hellem ATCC 50504]AFM97998.1 hypothetical protein EHEL_031020 [Encephalitozoon hellem ATCC 50504]UTX42802.1 WD40 domain-containing protein [Encephalitozoon hellem]|eukprot:XP_003886979.1 hypothetical protein EHEL_031020 [Encephalitozoon hellem ATCC 50504]